MAASDRLTPSFAKLQSSSLRASSAARGASKKSNTKPEVLLRRALWAAGLRYRKNSPHLPGKPDIVFHKARVAVFCDGDFWHGRDWESRRTKLVKGANAGYWLAKITRNIARDIENTRSLEAMGWRVVRVWEGEIHSEIDDCVRRIIAAVTCVC